MLWFLLANCFNLAIEILLVWTRSETGGVGIGRTLFQSRNRDSFGLDSDRLKANNSKGCKHYNLSPSGFGGIDVIETVDFHIRASFKSLLY